MDEEVLREDDLGAAIPLDALLVTDLPRSPQRNRPGMRLSGRRAWRIALLTLVLVATMMADVLWGPSMLTWLSANPPSVSIPTLPNGPAVAIMGASSWHRMTLPVADNLIEWLEASPGEPNQIYACVGTNYTSQEMITGPPTLWASDDAGAHWQVAHRSIDEDAGCSLRFDSTNAQHMALYKEDFGNATQTPCAGSLSLSTDGGHTWQPRRVAPMHTSAALQTVYCELVVTANHVYIEADFTNDAPDIQHHREYTVLMRSDDGGISWHDITPIHADGIATTSWSTLIATDTLISHVDMRHTDSLTQTLWESHDAGNHWQQTSANSSLVFNIFLSTPNMANVLYGITGFAPPSGYFVTHALYSATGARWAYLPKLPVPHTNAEHPGIFSSLGVTTQGNLIVVGVAQGASLPLDKNGNITSQLVPLTLWEWDRTRQQWHYLDLPIPLAEPQSCGGCFQSSLAHGLSPDGATLGTYVLLRDWYPSSAAWRIFIPDLT